MPEQIPIKEWIEAIAPDIVVGVLENLAQHSEDTLLEGPLRKLGYLTPDFKEKLTKVTKRALGETLNRYPEYRIAGLAQSFLKPIILLYIHKRARQGQIPTQDELLHEINNKINMDWDDARQLFRRHKLNVEHFINAFFPIFKNELEHEQNIGDLLIRDDLRGVEERLSERIEGFAPKTKLNTTDYLNNIVASPQTIYIPEPIQQAYNAPLERFPPEQLYCFEPFGTESSDSRSVDPNLVYDDLVKGDAIYFPLLIIGESGIGKTTLADQLLYDIARLHLDQRTNLIPVLVKLAHFTPSQGVLSLIHISLVSKGLKIERANMETVLQANPFFVILDAFDEITDANSQDAELELVNILENFVNSKFIITTRHFRLPRVLSIKKYALNSLTHQQISAFSKKYLPETHQDFLNHLNDMGLESIASNTLLLALLILIYLDSGTLPESKGQVLHTVVSKVLTHNKAKRTRHKMLIRETIIRQALQKLAESTISSSASYVLPNEMTDGILSDFLSKLEKQRLVPASLTLDDFLDYLASTGFVLRTNDGTSFWHRAFAEYFAAQGSVNRYSEIINHLNEMALIVEWTEIWPLFVSHLTDPNEFLQKLLEVNVFAAARALKETKAANPDITEQIWAALENRCESEWYQVRQMAMTLLLQQNNDRIITSLHRLVNSTRADIKGRALEEIAKRSIQDARKIVFEHLNWDQAPELYVLALGSSITWVIIALAEFNDIESQQQILDIWKAKGDIITASHCLYAFEKLIDKGVIHESIVEELFTIFWSDQEEITRSKLMPIRMLLSKLKEKSIALRIIDIILSDPSTLVELREWALFEILVAYDDPDVIDKIFEAFKNPNVSTRRRLLLARVLANSAGQLSNRIIFELARHSDPEFRAYGIKTLQRVNFDRGKQIILPAIHVPTQDETDNPIGYAQVQTATFETLAFFNKLELLLEPENQFTYYYNNAAIKLFELISVAKLSRLGTLIDAILESALESADLPFVIIAGIKAYIELGASQKAYKIAERFWVKNQKDSNLVPRIIEIAHLLPHDFSLEIIRTVLENFVTGGNSVHIRSECIIALGRIGTEQACDMLAEIIWNAAHSEKHILESELGLRHMQPYVSTDREEWLIKLLNTQKLQRHDLRRALETLGFAGTTKAISVLQPYLENPDPNIRFVSFWAVQRIHYREGKLWFNGEERFQQSSSSPINSN